MSNYNNEDDKLKMMTFKRVIHMSVERIGTLALIHIPIIYKYENAIEVQWMLSNGYTTLLHYKLDRDDTLRMGSVLDESSDNRIIELRQLIQDIFKTKDIALSVKLFNRFKTEFLQVDNCIDLACFSGSLDVVKLLVSLSTSNNSNPITRDALENAFYSGSLELVQYLDKFIDIFQVYRGTTSNTNVNQRILKSYHTFALEQSTIEPTKFINNFIIPVLFLNTEPSHIIQGYPLLAIPNNNSYNWSIENMHKELKNNESYFLKVCQALPWIFQQQDNINILDTQVRTIMKEIDCNNRHIYQPIYNMIFGYESLLQNNHSLETIGLVHNQLIKSVVRLGVVSRLVFMYLLGGGQSISKLEQIASFIHQHITLDQLKLLLQLDPSIATSFRITKPECFEEDVFLYLLEIGILTEEVVIGQWKTSISIGDLPSIRFGILAMTLIQAGGHPSYHQSYQHSNLTDLCRSNNHYNNQLVLYLVESKKCCVLYALGAAIRAANYRLFDQIAALSSENEQNTQYPMTSGVDKALQSIIGVNDFDRFGVFINHINDNLYSTAVSPKFCLRYGRTWFLGKIIFKYQSLPLH
ncbi:hypothetical protein DFA_07327 [Cavenderia fasciculata]|uniref:Ankyrin repeat-containing protein n=1 Tax=Cavenderia fasciculata TaxID=261658 RepID=F4PW43_CACFS|nr:uncharacterized protein DFA_07327 [Cavenderia fasciculata]EGG20207.1 hypothetical protein DFA_07327 [Cavenderia fasciculata]|eukprot:XP_004367190.1 hypothetical protein DFA_07327 [Cavenderia fasciculata]